MTLRTILAATLLIVVAACEDNSGEPTTTSTSEVTTTAVETTIATTTTWVSPTTTSLPPPDLNQLEAAVLALIPETWSNSRVARAPFTITVCGRSVRVVDADPTDESPGRPREGINISAGGPEGESISLLVYSVYEETVWESIEAALPVCGSTTQTNPVDGWTLRTLVDADYDTISGLIGIRVSSDSERVYTGNRATRYSASRLFHSRAGAALVRVSVSDSGTDPEALAGVDDLMYKGAEILRLAAAG